MGKFFAGLLTSGTPFDAPYHPMGEALTKLAFPKELKTEKQINLVSPKSSGAECKTDVWPEFCTLLGKEKWAADVTTNVLGSAKILNGKGNKVKLESCETNGVLGFLM